MQNSKNMCVYFNLHCLLCICIIWPLKAYWETCHWLFVKTSSALIFDLMMQLGCLENTVPRSFCTFRVSWRTHILNNSWIHFKYTLRAQFIRKTAANCTMINSDRIQSLFIPNRYAQYSCVIFAVLCSYLHFKYRASDLLCFVLGEPDYPSHVDACKVNNIYFWKT